MIRNSPRGEWLLLTLETVRASARLRTAPALRRRWGFRRLTGCRWERAAATSIQRCVLPLRETKLSVEEAERLLYNESGLLGVSGISNDMRELRVHAATHRAARLAIDLFVYRIGRELGSLIAALGGIDALVFTAGIGENDAATRAEVFKAPHGPASSSTRPQTRKAARKSLAARDHPPGSSPRMRNS